MRVERTPFKSIEEHEDEDIFSNNILSGLRQVCPCAFVIITN
jgi:hypothetical protein